MRVALVIAAVVGCNDAVTLDVTSDRPIPTAIDAMCLGVADQNPHGGHFGAHYDLDELPQSLRLEPGGADHALSWVRGDRGGVPVARASAAVDFGGDVTLALPACVKGPAAPAHVVGSAGPAMAKLAVSEGQGGALIVAFGDVAQVIDAHRGTLVANDLAPPAGNVLQVIAVDVDGDCDDDLVVVTDAAPPQIYLRDAESFTVGGSVGDAIVAAVAAGDLDRDGDQDVITGSGGTLVAYLNDGAASFTAAPQLLSGASLVSKISALALGDVDGDGYPDLIVGQAGPPLAAWLGDGGTFAASTSIVPPVALDVESLAFGDADGDFDPDLAVAVTGEAMRLYVDRDGHLEDQSFVRLPQPIDTAHAIAFGGFDAACPPDAVIASDAGAALLAGQDEGVFAPAEMLPAATDVVLADIDDDGDLDAVFATADGVTWVAR
ncbi:MAG: VCBS repeat-containing protein [Kofleriaceae bacterium]